MQRQNDDNDRIAWYLNYATILARQHNVPKEWTITTDRATTRAGLCNYRTQQLSFSKYLFTNTDIDIKDVTNIILHEIAHILAGPYARHGPEWKNKALEIGCDAKRCHTLLLRSPKEKMACTCGSIVRTYYRIPIKKAIYCRACKTPCDHVVV